MSDHSARLRLGGMALANGLLVSGPTSWAVAVVDDDGQVVVGSGPRPRIAAGMFERVPLARGVIRMAESMMAVPTARAGMPEARLAMEDAPVGIVMASTMIAHKGVRSGESSGQAKGPSTLLRSPLAELEEARAGEEEDGTTQKGPKPPDSAGRTPGGKAHSRWKKIGTAGM